MPAPLGKVPTRKMPKIDVLGLEDSAPTRNAVRFFRERRIVARYRDLRKAPLRADEIRWFAEHLGAGILATEGGDIAGLVGRILADPSLLRLPLVRFGERATAGRADDTWRAWLAAGR